MKNFNGVALNVDVSPLANGDTCSESGFAMTALSGRVNIIDNDFAISVLPTLALFDDDVVDLIRFSNLSLLSISAPVDGQFPIFDDGVFG